MALFSTEDAASFPSIKMVGVENHPLVVRCYILWILDWRDENFKTMGDVKQGGLRGRLESISRPE